MKGVSEGAIPLDDVVAGHIDACLGCMACVTACPSGVRYDLLIEATRERIETAVTRPSDPRDDVISYSFQGGAENELCGVRWVPPQYA